MYILKLKNKTKYGKTIKKNKQTNLKSIYCGIMSECSLGKNHKANPRKKTKKQKSKENFNSNDRSPVLQRRNSGTQIFVILFNWDSNPYACE